MATKFQKINEITTVTTVGADDYMMLHDGNGSCKEIKCSDYQAVTPPPELWQKFIFDDIKIAHVGGNYTRTTTIDNYTQFSDKALGIAIPEFGRIIYPEIIRLPWGSNANAFVTSSVTSSDRFTLTCGNIGTTAAYTASEANRGNDCAIGYAHNFSKFVLDNGTMKGIPAGSWYVPSPSEMEMVVYPRFRKLAYAASLMGYTWSTNAGYWTCYDGSKTMALRFYPYNVGNVIYDAKTNNFCVMLMAMLPIEITVQS